MAESYFYGTGRRKSAVARVFMKRGSGAIVVNGKPIDQFGWGKPIHGLALTKIDGRATVLVSDAESVTAFRLQR